MSKLRRLQLAGRTETCNQNENENMKLKTGVLICSLLFLSGCFSAVSTPTTTGSMSLETPSSTPAVADENDDTDLTVEEPTDVIDSADVDTADEMFVIDVRTLPEWNSGHLEQATHIPHTEIGSRIGEVTTNKDAKILLYCKVGGRAGRAKTTLEELGYTNVENGGGYEDVVKRFQQ